MRPAVFSSVCCLKENLKKTVPCPHCGASIPENAKACRACGSDEQTGWSDRTYLDGIALPDDESYEDLVESEFGEKKTAGMPSWVIPVAIITLIALIYGIVRVVTG